MNGRRRRSTTHLLLVAFLQLFHAATVYGFSPAEDDDAAVPGMKARYTANGKAVERIDPDVSFVWDAHPPDGRLPAGPFDAHWTGRLLVQQETQHQFHVFVEGEVSLRVNGKQILTGRRDSPGWISSEPIALDFGEKELQVNYRRTGGAARVQLYWSSERFPLEPIPAHLLFLDRAEPAFALVEKGRREFESHRCGRCHQGANTFPGEPGPALVQVAAGLRHDQIVAKILQTYRTAAHARMPRFGVSRSEAEAMAAALVADSEKVEFDSVKPSKNAEQDRGAGELLVRTLGCLACHRVGPLGQESPYGGGDLSDVGHKRAAEWLYTWLAHPEVLNQDHRMPVFSLSEDERRQLATYLSRLRNHKNVTETPAAIDPPTKSSGSEPVELGRRLLAAARCAACHRLPGNIETPAQSPQAAIAPADIANSCLSETPDKERWRPAYATLDREALLAYLRSQPGDLSQRSPFEEGTRLVERRNCISCHRRDGAGGLAAVAGSAAKLDTALQGQSETLVPPALNAVGDKLADDALEKAIRGEQKPRLPWLKVRMPRFRHTQEEQAALLAYLIGHDRIPDSVPDTHQTRVAGSHSAEKSNPKSSGSKTQDDEQNDASLLAGHALIGAKGFNCLACHQAGRYIPKNTAPATRGSDLLTLGGRMRREFFLRWTRSPLRILPGIEMPSYERPAPGILDGDVDRQLAALWSALGDPRFTVPTNPTAVEQFLTVRAGEPARIVRDVFTNPKPNGGGNIARALAVGLHNGHNLLYDLSCFSVRQWTVGEFARQRTEGKSWYWDMAGLPVASGFAQRCDVALAPRRTTVDALVFPEQDHATSGRLLSYRNEGKGIVVSYLLPFHVGGHDRVPCELTVTETVVPVERVKPAEQAGWERRIEVSGMPEGFDAVFVRPNVRPLIGAPTIAAIGESPAWESTKSAAEQSKAGVDAPDKSIEFVRLRPPMSAERNGSTLATAIRMDYLCTAPAATGELNIQTLPVPDREKVTSVPGFDGIRLPLERSIMPTSMAWTADGGLAFTSLKGHVYVARDTDGDGIEDRIELFEEGLAAPFGVIADGRDLIVAHKPELLRLIDTDGDGKADRRAVVAAGWGFTDNYHDWTCGIVRDSAGNLYVGLGSDYTQKKRPKEASLWRGKVLRIDPQGAVTPIGHAFRYPTGLAVDEHDRIFVTDQQGEQNTFNELNLLLPGRHYGVPSRHEEKPDATATPPAIQIPHPWTRSVNGVVFLPQSLEWGPLAGHAIGCEYDSRFLVRFTLQQVGDVVQGAAYYFSRPDAGAGSENFLGPMCATVGPHGDLYIGSIHDSGWLGGQNTGDIVRLHAKGPLPNGIRELRATPDGFEILFFAEIESIAARRTENYSISAYTRTWAGGYATPDAERHRVAVRAIDVADDAQSVRLHVDRLREGFVYEVTAGRLNPQPKLALFPATGHYTLLRIPANASPTSSERR